MKKLISDEDVETLRGVLNSRPTNKYVCGQPCPNLGKPECVHTPRRSKWWGTRRCRDADMHVDFGMHKATSRRNLKRQ